MVTQHTYWQLGKTYQCYAVPATFIVGYALIYNTIYVEGRSSSADRACSVWKLPTWSKCDWYNLQRVVFINMEHCGVVKCRGADGGAVVFQIICW